MLSLASLNLFGASRKHAPSQIPNFGQNCVAAGNPSSL